MNLVPAIEGSPITRTKPLYWRWGGSVAYREGPWKIVVDESFENPELYNLDSDVAETTDLSTDEPERLANMMQRLRQYTHEVEAEAPDWWKNQSWRKKKAKANKNFSVSKAIKKNSSRSTSYSSSKDFFHSDCGAPDEAEDGRARKTRRFFSVCALFGYCTSTTSL